MELDMLYTNATFANVLPKVLEITTSISQGNRSYGQKALPALLTTLSTLLAERPPITSPLLSSDFGSMSPITSYTEIDYESPSTP